MWRVRPTEFRPTVKVQGQVHWPLHMIGGKMPELEVTFESSQLISAVFMWTMRSFTHLYDECESLTKCIWCVRIVVIVIVVNIIAAAAHRSNGLWKMACSNIDCMLHTPNSTLMIVFDPSFRDNFSKCLECRIIVCSIVGGVAPTWPPASGQKGCPVYYIRASLGLLADTCSLLLVSSVPLRPSSLGVPYSIGCKPPNLCMVYIS